MVGIPRHLHVQPRRVICWCGWSPVRRGRLETCQLCPAGMAGPTYSQDTTMARLALRADATGRSLARAEPLPAGRRLGDAWAFGGSGRCRGVWVWASRALRRRQRPPTRPGFESEQPTEPGSGVAGVGQHFGNTPVCLTKILAGARCTAEPKAAQARLEARHFRGRRGITLVIRGIFIIPIRTLSTW